MSTAPNQAATPENEYTDTSRSSSGAGSDNTPTVATSARWKKLVARFRRNPRAALKRSVLWLIDACSGSLSSLRIRVGGDLEDNGKRRDDRGGLPERSKAQDQAGTGSVAEVSSSSTSKTRSPLRAVLVGVLGMVVAGIGGMTFSFSLFSMMVINQAERIDDQMEEISRWGHQYSKIQNSEAKFRRENMDLNKRIDDSEKTQRSGDCGNGSTDANHVTNTSKMDQSATGNAIIRPPGSSTSRNVPRAVGECAIGANNSAENLARCLKDYNRG